MATRIKNFVLKLRPGTWSLNRLLDLRLALWLLVLGILGAIAGLFWGVTFAIAGLVVALAGLGVSARARARAQSNFEGTPDTLAIFHTHSPEQVSVPLLATRIQPKITTSRFTPPPNMVSS